MTFKFCTTSSSENNSSKHSFLTGTYLHAFTSEVLERETASGNYLMLNASTSVSDSSSETCEGLYSSHREPGCARVASCKLCLNP